MSTPISDVKSKTMFFGNVNNTSKTQEVQGKDSFSEIFDKTQSPVEKEMTDANAKKDASVKTEDAESIQNHANIQKKKSSEQLKGQTEDVTDVKEDVDAATMEAAQEMVGKIAETLGVIVEEVESVLETLGLSVVDLLNTENLTKVVLALNPECDALSLMTNEGLFTDLKELMNTAQELKAQIVQDFNLTEEEMTAVLNSLKEQTEVQLPTEATVQEAPQLAETVAEVEPVAVPVEVDVMEATTLSEEEGTNVRTEVKEVEVANTSYEGTVIPKNEASQNVHSNSSETREDANASAGQQFTQSNFVNQLADAVENANSSSSSYGVRGQDIINQITEHIRVHVKQDTTEMELQLHPASLGNVRVQLTSAGGVLTAVFTTENEAVKTALESQLIQLKENFTQQGLKVESVEVNVSAQGFERSLDQQEQEQNRFEDNRNRKSGRRIRLNGLEASEDIMAEDMTADDRIVADMMIRNGNTVDYTV